MLFLMFVTSVLVVLAVRYMVNERNYPQSHYEVWRALMANVFCQILVSNALMFFCFWLYFSGRR